MSDFIDVQKVATLARLHLDASEELYFQEKFRDILEYVGAISQVEVGSEAKEKDETLQQVFHKDLSRRSSVTPEQFSDFTENHFFKVPSVIE